MAASRPQAAATGDTRMYPAPRTDLMIFGSSTSASSFLRKRPTCTSIVRSNGAASRPRVCSSRKSRDSTRPGCRTKARRRSNSPLVRPTSCPSGEVRRLADASSSQLAKRYLLPAAVAGGLGAPQDGLDLRGKLAQVEGLGHVVVRSDLETHDLVDGVAPARDDDQAATPMLSQLPGDRKPVFAGQPEIQEDERRRISWHELHQCATVVQLRNAIAVAAQIARHQGRDVHLVVENGDVRGSLHRRFAECCRRAAYHGAQA